jgi:hypothetical protein
MNQSSHQMTECTVTPNLGLSIVCCGASLTTDAVLTSRYFILLAQWIHVLNSVPGPTPMLVREGSHGIWPANKTESKPQKFSDDGLTSDSDCLSQPRLFQYPTACAWLLPARYRPRCDIATVLFLFWRFAFKRYCSFDVLLIQLSWTVDGNTFRLKILSSKRVKPFTLLFVVFVFCQVLPVRQVGEISFVGLL